jgi:tripartite motif-containing protein 71
VISPTALAVDAAGDLYVAEAVKGGPIQKRDSQGNGSPITMPPGPYGLLHGLAADTEGNLYVATVNPLVGSAVIRKRDALGNWSVISSRSNGDQFAILAVDASGNLYVKVTGNAADNGIQKFEAQGKWSVIGHGDRFDLGGVYLPTGLAVESSGILYVADQGPDVGRIQKRDTQEEWSVIAPWGSGLGQVATPSGLAVDEAGNLYVADTGNNRVQEYSPGP